MEFTNRKFGVEVEFFGISSSKAVAALNAAGINTEYRSYTHQTTSYWKVTTDASVSNEGLELVSPVLSGEAGLRELKVAVKALESAGAKVDKSCGLHVHHDAGDMNHDQIANVVLLYAKWQNVINLLVPETRRNGNHYCKPIPAYFETLIARGYDVFAAAQSAGMDRYYKVNLDAYFRHGTIEFRQHSGTVDAEKIAAWVVLTQNLMTKALGRRNARRSTCSFKTFRDWLGFTGKFATDEISKQAATVITKRFQKFSNPLHVTMLTAL